MKNLKIKINKLLLRAYFIILCSFLFSLKLTNSSLLNSQIQNNENFLENSEEKLKNFSELIKLSINPFVRGFLTLIAFCEGTEILDIESYKKICKKYGVFPASLNSYKILFSYKGFKNFSDHPRTIIKSKNIASSAAGRYQILTRTFDGFLDSFKPIGVENKSILINKKIKNLIQHAFNLAPTFYKNFSSDFKNIYKKPDDLLIKLFGPFMQDICAINLLIEHKAIDDVLKGNYELAIKKLVKIWASFPTSNGKSHYKNQNSKKPITVKKLSKITISSILENENLLKKILKKSKIFLSEILSSEIFSKDFYKKFNNKMKGVQVK